MSRRISETDNGTEMLRCNQCDARVIADHYSKAVGLKGYQFCPYCGAKMEVPKSIQKAIDRLNDFCSYGERSSE